MRRKNLVLPHAISPDNIPAFIEYLKRLRFIQVEAKGEWEALRFRRDDEYISLYKRKGRVMLTVPTGLALQTYVNFMKEAELNKTKEEC